jgi:TPR repeat protein/serine/threonine protein kinase
LDTLQQDIENHDEAVTKLLSLLKHRPLSVNEVKVLKSEIQKLKTMVEQKRMEIKGQRNTKSSQLPMVVAGSSPANSRPGSATSATSALSSSTTCTSPVMMAALGARSLPPIPGQSSASPFKNNNNNNDNNNHQHRFHQLQNYGRPDSPASNYSGGSSSQNHSGTSAVSSSSATSSLSIDFNAQLLNRLLNSTDSLTEEEIISKKRILDSMTVQSKDVEVTKTRVGRGIFGDVCLGTLRNRYKVSIKTLKRSDDPRKDEHRRRLIEKEMLVTKYLGSYPTIPLCYGYVTNNSCIQVVLELAPYGSLSLLLHDNQAFPIIPVAVKIAWLSDLADAMRFLHSKEVMHKSVSCDNLLVFEKLRVKLCDFGPEKQTSTKGIGRSEADVKAFTAPEVREGKNPEYGSDVYSYAITAIQVFSRRVPHLERPNEQIQSAVEKEWIEPIESKDSLMVLLNSCLNYDPNEHVNTSRPSAEDVFLDILSILETVGGDPREEMSSIDYFVIQEIETTARQKRNETLRQKSSYKSNLALKNNTNYNLVPRSGNLTQTIRNSGRFNGVGQPNMSTFSYSQFKLVPDNISVNGEYHSGSMDMEDKASIAYFLVQAAGFPSVEADFLADRLVRKGVSCVSTLRRKLHRDSNYLSSIGIDKEKARHISTAIFNIKSTNGQESSSKNVFLNQNSNSNNQFGSFMSNHSNSSSSRPVNKMNNNHSNSGSLYQKSLQPSSSFVAAKATFNNSNSHSTSNYQRHSNNSNSSSLFEQEGQTDRDNDESDSFESSNEINGNNKGLRFSPSTKGSLNNRQSVSSFSTISTRKGVAVTREEINLEKGLTAPSVDYEEDVVADSLPKESKASHESRSAKQLYATTKNLLDKRNYLSKFLRVELNLTPDLANKYSDILISREIYDIPTLRTQMMNDDKILIKYGFDVRISQQIFDNMTQQVVDRFEHENHKTNDLDMSINARTIVNNVSAMHTPAAFIRKDSASSLLKEYVDNNCSTSNPLDIANLYYEASQLSNSDALEKLLEIADNGDYLAQGFLMRMYGLGQGDVKQDILIAKEMGTKLFPWLQHAIQTEINSAQLIMLSRYLTGVCYSLGLGVQQNDGEAVKWYLQSAHQGYIGAQAYLGYCYYLGVGVEKNLEEAFNWYKMSALRGHSASQCNLGLCFEYGHGTEKNLQDAIKWYRASADQGDVIAQYSLGSIYEKGKAPIPQNFKEAFKYYKLSADRGYDQAQYSLGCCYYAGLGNEQNLEESFRYFSMASQNGNAAAQCKIGFCYENGIGIQKNVHKAVENYRLSAEQGNAGAMYYLGYCYFTGMGCETNVKEAVKLYTLSAQRKYPAAQNNLGFCYFNGIGVPKDLTSAIKWYAEAAKQEYPAAQYNLGYCYEKGLGIPVDMNECAVWYEKAAKNGHARAKKSLKRMNNEF